LIIAGDESKCLVGRDFMGPRVGYVRLIKPDPCPIRAQQLQASVFEKGCTCKSANPAG
jgi:hypothetical protein